MGRRTALIALVASCVSWPAAARADAPSRPACAPVLQSPAPEAAPDSACWTDVTPYPFGSDGNSVDASDPLCAPLTPAGSRAYTGDQLGCYLTVTSMAFRAFNRGLAAASPASGSGTTPFGVWLYNGTRWYPDPTFPGQSVCKGTTVLWAGKRDYWLVDANNWGDLCRFDGDSFQWEPIPVPDATLSWANDRSNDLKVRGTRRPGEITSGSCFSWDNCWFFGSFGVVDHWDGNTLTDASPDLANDPWLDVDFSAADVATDPAGKQFAYAVGRSSSAGNLPENTANKLASPPSGTPYQLFGSMGDPFLPTSYTPPTNPRSGDRYRTDLAAIGFNSHGAGWLAGNPVGRSPNNYPTTNRTVTTTQDSPIVSLGEDGKAHQCSSITPTTFTWTGGSPPSYVWGSLATVDGSDPPTSHSPASTGLPAVGDVLAGGQGSFAAGTSANDDGSTEPVVVQGGCGAPPVVTRFRELDPTVPQATAPMIPADLLTGSTTSVASPAGNDAWAATSAGQLPPQNTTLNPPTQRPHLYQFTDGRAPDAPAGDDEEARQLFFAPDPPIIVQAPPDDTPIQEPDTTVTQAGKSTTRKVTLKPAIYGIGHKVTRPKGKSTRFTLTITFRIRRTVTIGIQALRRSTVVATSGLRRFKPGRGSLKLVLSTKHYPTRLRFVQPKAPLKKT